MRGDRTPDTSQLQKLCEALQHRGPDGHGVHVHQSVGFVHTRLSIIDSAHGAQPFVHPTGTSLIANGEIYNYIELRAALEDQGLAAQLMTGSDCETILPLYQQHGLDLVPHLRGMYAFALHDPQQDRVILARDPFGIKPLYYVEMPDGIAFASEPQALIKADIVVPEVSVQARLELMQMRYTTGRETIFKGIQRVLPGEVLEIVGGRIVSRQRHDHLRLPMNPKIVSLEDAVQHLDHSLAESVMMHRRSDVPYGMFLSGGSDSAAVLALMARQMDVPVTAYTAGFPGTEAPDERAQARRVAQAVGAKHVELDVTADDFYAHLPKIVAAADDPAADYALIPTFFLAQRARQDVKVVLSGEGGDEILAGYGRYRSALRPFWMGGRVIRSKGPFDHVPALSISQAGWRDGIMMAREAARYADWTKLQQIQAADCADWLPNDLLMKLDRCLMHQGVEGRTPFLDPEVARVAFNLPDALKIRKKTGKLALREWLTGVLPEAEPFRKKQGFTVPVGNWISARQERLANLLTRQIGVQEIIYPGGVHRVFQTDTKHGHFAAWTLLFYGLWHQIHMRGISPEGSIEEVLAA